MHCVVGHSVLRWEKLPFRTGLVLQIVDFIHFENLWRFDAGFTDTAFSESPWSSRSQKQECVSLTAARQSAVFGRLPQLALCSRGSLLPDSDRDWPIEKNL